MYGLLKALYCERQQRAFESLYTASEARDQMLLRATLAEALKDCPRILESHGSDWMLCTLASFNRSPDDTLRVFQAIMRHLDHFSVGLLDDKIQWREMNEVADSCLVGLSFFYEHLHRNYKRRAAPSPDYYKQVGVIAFQRIGYDTISDEFDGWISFIKKEMTND